MIVKCFICKREFKRVPAKIKEKNYCSPKCSYKGRSLKREKKCLICSKNYLVHNFRFEKSKFCSDECRWESRKNIEFQTKPNKIEIFDDHAEIIINSKTHGKHKALIDIGDIDKAKVHTWLVRKSDKVFYVTSSKKKHLHRIIMDYDGKLTIDHINRNPLDNRKSNLRICTMAENLKNRGEIKLYKNNKTGYKGVRYDSRRNKYEAYLRINNKIVFYQRFNTKNEATEARLKAEKLYLKMI